MWTKATEEQQHVKIVYEKIKYSKMLDKFKMMTILKDFHV
jgi:hypothetical protein